MATVVVTLLVGLAGTFLLWAGRHVAGVLCLAVAVWGLTDLARAEERSGRHGDGHAQHHHMYRDWQRPDVGGSCCNAQSAYDPNGDCRPMTAGGGRGWGRGRTATSSCHPTRSSIGPPRRCHVCKRYGVVICFQPCDPKS